MHIIMHYTYITGALSRCVVSIFIKEFPNVISVDLRCRHLDMQPPNVALLKQGCAFHTFMICISYYNVLVYIFFHYLHYLLLNVPFH